ncbi:MAG: phage head closure protein [Pikeienuella sp.]
MDERITFQQEVRSDDGVGGRLVDWQTLSNTPTVWAHVAPVTTREGMSNEEIVAVGTYKFSIRNRSDLNETMRLIWDGTVYNIEAVQRMGRRAMYMEIIAKRGVRT